jgi:subtilase family serine protease
MNCTVSFAGKLLNRWIAVSALMLLAGISLLGQAKPRTDRITHELGSGALVRMNGSAPAAPQHAHDLGAVEPGLHLESLSLTTTPGTAETRELQALIAAQQDARSAQYHRWLTQEQFGARFGLTEGDLGKIKGWLEAQGFQVEEVAPSRNHIRFSGSAAQFEQAFKTRLHRFQVEGSERIANTTELALPRELDGLVARIGGVGMTRPKAQSWKPAFTASNTGFHYLTPADWATIYDVNPIYLAGYTGAGVHIGVLGQTYVPQADIEYFRTAAGLNAGNITYACISASNCTSTSGQSMTELPQSDLDIEWAGGIAKGATIDYIYTAASDTSHSSLDALTNAVTTYNVNGAVVPILALSYGICESPPPAQTCAGRPPART